MREPHVHEHQNREHRQRQDRRPLQQEAEHDDDERDVLRVPYPGIDTLRRQPPAPLRLIQDPPGGGQQDEAPEDQHVARNMQRTEMRISLPAEDRGPQMPAVVRHQVGMRMQPGEPAGQQVDRQRKAVHLRKQRHDKGTEGAEGTPVARSAWLGEAEGEDDEDGRVQDDQHPEPIGALLRHDPPPLSSAPPWPPCP